MSGQDDAAVRRLVRECGLARSQARHAWGQACDEIAAHPGGFTDLGGELTAEGVDVAVGIVRSEYGVRCR